MPADGWQTAVLAMRWRIALCPSGSIRWNSTENTANSRSAQSASFWPGAGDVRRSQKEHMGASMQMTRSAGRRYWRERESSYSSEVQY